MDPNAIPERPKPSSPVVSIPVHLYHQMALCFYGEGDRYWELATGHTAARNLSPHPPETPLVPAGAHVPTIPPQWIRVRTDDEPSATETTDR